MADIFSKEVRSYCMSQIRSKDTKPELIVRRHLFSKGFRFRTCQKNLPGTPDIVLRKYHTAIFIHGCFWHGHEGCKLSRLPKTRVEYWQNKIERNRVRDAESREKLRELGWRTMVIWECQLKKSVRESTLENIVLLLEKTYLDIHKQKKSLSKYTIEENTLSVAAEDCEPYGKRRKPKQGNVSSE